jgi:hypothetical protein
MRLNDWSVSKFSDKVRGNVKPPSATMEEWDKWEADQKQNNRVRYWLADEGLTKLQDIIYFPYDVCRHIKRYILNRFFDKTHALVASKKHIKRGSWIDLSDRLLYCMFDSLVDFVEIECAYHNLAWMEPEKRKMYKLPFAYKFFNTRLPQLGIDYLIWSASLGDEYPMCTKQAEYSKTALELYYWWKKRDARIDPYEIEDTRNAFDIEAEYDNEDDEMLIKLIKIRHHLWT